MKALSRILCVRTGLKTGCCVLAALVFSSLVPGVVLAADTERHSGPAMEAWVEGQIEATTVTVDQYTTVTLDEANNRLIVEDFTFTIRGVSFGLNEVRIDFGAGTDIEVTGELDVCGVQPRFWADATVECDSTDGVLYLSSFDDLHLPDAEFAGGFYYPALTAEEFQSWADNLSCILQKSGIAVGVDSGAGTLTGLAVIDDSGTAKVECSWSGGSTTLHGAAAIKAELDSGADSIASQMGGYFSAGEAGGKWFVDIEVGTEVESGYDLVNVDFEFAFCSTKLGITDLNLAFNGSNGFDVDLAETVNSVLFFGDKTTNFTGAGTLAFDGSVPSISFEHITMSDEWAGWQQFITDINSPLFTFMESSIDSLVEDSSLEAGLPRVGSIYVDDDDLVLEGPLLVEGDANLDGNTNIIDAMFIAQYTVGLRELTGDQMVTSDTTDDGWVNIIDAMHIAQFTVDPYSTAGVLFKPLWEEGPDDAMIDPLTV